MWALLRMWHSGMSKLKTLVGEIIDTKHLLAITIFYDKR